jgi:hypothetical protein
MSQEIAGRQIYPFKRVPRVDVENCTVRTAKELKALIKEAQS